jgi:hypothetical protein
MTATLQAGDKAMRNIVTLTLSQQYAVYKRMASICVLCAMYGLYRYHNDLAQALLTGVD